MVFHYTDSEERGGAMRKMIPFAPWQTAYFTRWLGEMSRQGWALKTIKWGRAVFVPAASGGRQYALFPSCAADEEIDELFRRIGDGSLTVPPELEHPMPSDLMLQEDPRLAELAGKIGPYQYVQLINQLRREKGWEDVCDWDAFTVMRQTRPDAAQPPELTAYAEAAKKHGKKQNGSTVINLLALLVAPALALISGEGPAIWQKITLGIVLATLVCYVVYLRLSRHVMAPEKWDMPYEECLRRAAGLTVLEAVVLVGTAISAVVYPILTALL